MSDYAGKRCLLTGAASGIGRATALALARRGAELYLTDCEAAGLETTVADARALGGTVAEHRALDISDYDAVAAFAADIHTRHPAMDVVLNIAGVSAWGTVDQLTHQQWRSMIDVNLMGPIHVIETFVPPMIAAATCSGVTAWPANRSTHWTTFGWSRSTPAISTDRTSGVCTAPGTTTETPMPCRARSNRSTSDSPRNPYLLAL